MLTTGVKFVEWAQNKRSPESDLLLVVDLLFMLPVSALQFQQIRDVH